MVSIIIVNYNAASLLEKSVNSIYQKLDQNSFELIIVDNNSHDSSYDFLTKEKFRSIVVFSKKNLGFSKACNIGAMKANGGYLLFLNPDVEIVDINLLNLIHIYNGHPRIGVLGVKQLGVNGRINKTCAIFPDSNQYWNKIIGLNKLFPNKFPFRFLNIDYNKSQFVDQVIGSFLFIKKSLFYKFQGFDQQFFVFYEEMDLAYRMSLKGYFNFYYSDMKIFHLGGGTTSRVKDLRLLYSWQSRLKYFRKHHSKFQYFQIKLIVFFIEPIFRILYGIISFKFSDIVETFKAWKCLIISNSHETNISPF